MPNRSKRTQREPLKEEDEEEMKVALGRSNSLAVRELNNFKNWISQLDSLGEAIFEGDSLWLQEVVEEVRSLVSGRHAPSNVTSPNASPKVSSVTPMKKEDDEEEEDEEEEEVPVLLPKTPKVKSKRKTLKRKSQEESDAEDSIRGGGDRKVPKNMSPPTSIPHSYKTEEATSTEEEEREENPSLPDTESSVEKIVPQTTPEKQDDVDMKEASTPPTLKQPEIPQEPTSAPPEDPPIEDEQPPVPSSPEKSLPSAPCDSTFVLRSDPETPVTGRASLRRSSRLSKEGSKEQKKCLTPNTVKNKIASKENCAPGDLAEDPSIRRSVRLVKQSAEVCREPLLMQGDNNEKKSKRASSPRRSLSQYKGLVNKAIRTSISADQKRNKSEELREEVQALENKFSTPLNQTKKIMRAFSATSSMGMKTASTTLQRSHSSVRHRSPLPKKVSSTIARSSRVFLSSKSASKLVPRTRGVGPSNIVRGLTSLLPQKPPPEDLKAKHEEELRRKELKEEEAIRRKEEIARLRVEEKKTQREARLKKVMENKKMLKKQPSITDLRKHELLAKNTNKQMEDKKAKEREEKEKEDTARKLEILKMQQEKEKLLEAQRKLEAERLAESKAIEEAKLRAKAAAMKVEKLPAPQLNVTITKEAPASNVNSYDMTPAPEDLPPQPLKDEDNYDLGDLKSDDETDDEEQPRKVVPKWAIGSLFRKAVFEQCYDPPNTDDLFAHPPMPNLDIIFPLKKRRFFKRTSSAVWNKAPIHE